VADQVVQVAVDGAGKKIDTSELTVGANTVERQRVNISDPTTAAAHTAVMNTAAAGTEYGAVVRPANPFPDRTAIAQSLVMSVNTTNNVAISTQGCGSFNVKITGSWTGTIMPEGTVDGTNWDQLTGFDIVNGVNRNTFTANGIALFSAAGYAQVRLRCSTVGTLTATVSLEASAGATPAFPFPPPQYYPQEGANASPGPTPLLQSLLLGVSPAGTNADRLRTAGAAAPGLGVLQTQAMTNSNGSWPTYSASKAAGVGVASATDVATLAGSATKTIYVTRIIFLATIATAQALGTVNIIKRSAADTGGTSTTTTAVPHDANSAAATGTCLFYTANPSVGAVIANVRTERYNFQVTGATVTPARLDIGFDNPITLRGTAQQLCVGLSGQGANATTIDVTFEWFEV
jgi:hypothetical protein